MDEESLFHAALEITDPAERQAFLDAAYADRPEARAAVEALLAAHDQGGNILDRPVVDRGVTAAANSAAEEGPGTTIGPYRLLEQIGEGGFGIVFLAEQQQPLRRTVALKTIKPGMDTRQVVARFEAERQTLAMMDHPHIARVIDGGTTPTGRPFFVMELVKGMTITKYCDEHQLTPRERLQLFLPVCQAIQHAHHKGIIHRDIKPSNVLVSSQDGQPVPKVIDFGVAKALGQPLAERTLVTSIGSILGTLEYMSPEQAEFHSVDVDTRTDIYSLGVLLYELLAGTTPLTKERLGQAALEECLRWIREEEPPAPSSRLTDSKEHLASISAKRRLEPGRLTKELRGELDWIVMKCLEKDRNRRYVTALGIAQDIERYLNDEPVDAGPPSARYKLRKFTRKHRKLLGVLGASALFLAFAAVGGTWLAIRAARAERLAARQRDIAIAEQQRANNEAAIARAVNKFLQDDLLSQADVRQQPADEVKSKDPTVRQLLDRASQTIHGKFPGQELTEAAIRRTLGNAYRGLGAYDEADHQLQRARKLRQEKLPANHPDILECINDLGRLQFDRGRYEEAEQLLRLALESRQDALRPNHPATLETMDNLAALYHRLGKFDESEKLNQQALQIRRESSDQDVYGMMRNLHGLARLFQARGSNHEAEAHFRQAIELAKQHLGADHPDTLSCLNDLGILYRILGRYDDAEKLYVEILDSRRRLFGDEHPETIGSISNLASLYLNAGDYAQAEPLFQQALELSVRKLGAEHPDTLATMSNLGVFYRSQGRYEQAEEFLKQALDGRRRLLGDEHPDTLATMNNLAFVYNSRGKLNLAEPLFTEALATSRKTLGADHPQTLASMNSVAVVHQMQGRFAEAEAMLRQVLEANRAKLGLMHPNTLATMSNLAGVLDDRGKLAEAVSLAKQTLESMQRTLGEDHPATLREMHNLAKVYTHQGNATAAIPLLEGALAKQQQKLGFEHPHTLKTLASLGVNYREAGEVDKAIQYLEEALAAARKQPGTLPAALIAVPSELGETYDRAGRLAEAETIYRESLGEVRMQHGDDDPLVEKLMVLLGSNLARQEKYAEAATMLKQAHKVLVARATSDQEEKDARSAHVIGQLVQLYENWGKPEEAQKWRERAAKR